MKEIATAVEDQTAKERSAQPSIPLTGQEYLASLNDGREVWIYGEKVKDVTKHSGLSKFVPDDRSVVRCPA